MQATRIYGFVPSRRRDTELLRGIEPYVRVGLGRAYARNPGMHESVDRTAGGNGVDRLRADRKMVTLHRLRF